MRSEYRSRPFPYTEPSVERFVVSWSLVFPVSLVVCRMRQHIAEGHVPRLKWMTAMSRYLFPPMLNTVNLPT